MSTSSHLKFLICETESCNEKSESLKLVLGFSATADSLGGLDSREVPGLAVTGLLGVSG